jgi:hypothetical protein
MPEDRHASIEEQVEYGLDTIPEDRLVSVPLRDLMYAFQTFRELVRFFHQRRSLDELSRFIGSKDSGALHLIWENYYRRLADSLPPDIEAALDSDRFDNPKSPWYYKPNENRDP